MAEPHARDYKSDGWAKLVPKYLELVLDGLVRYMQEWPHLVQWDRKMAGHPAAAGIAIGCMGNTAPDNRHAVLVGTAADYTPVDCTAAACLVGRQARKNCIARKKRAFQI